jgi:hypothetical protein
LPRHKDKIIFVEREFGYEMGADISAPCPRTEFDVCDDESSDSATRELIKFAYVI